MTGGQCSRDEVCGSAPKCAGCAREPEVGRLERELSDARARIAALEAERDEARSEVAAVNLGAVDLRAENNRWRILAHEVLAQVPPEVARRLEGLLMGRVAG